MRRYLGKCQLHSRPVHEVNAIVEAKRMQTHHAQSHHLVGSSSLPAPLVRLKATQQAGTGRSRRVPIFSSLTVPRDDSSPFGGGLTASFGIDRERQSVTSHFLRPEPEQGVRAQDRFHICHEPNILALVSLCICNWGAELT